MSRAGIIALLSVPALVAGQWLIWAYAPMEETMGLVQKIFYTHLPLAWWAMFSFFLVFAASGLYLLRRKDSFDLLAGAAAELGVLFSGLALASGSIWARAAWNVWWTWDPRLTTALIMWFIYAAYLVLRSAPLGGERKAMACAVLGIVGFLDVPPCSAARAEAWSRRCGTRPWPTWGPWGFCGSRCSSCAGGSLTRRGASRVWPRPGSGTSCPKGSGIKEAQ